MRQFIISTDSTADLPDDYIKGHNLTIHPLYYSFGSEKVYGDEIKLSPSDFYARMRKGEMPTTMASNPDFVQNTFKKAIDAGYDILHLSFSSALSSSYNTAAVAAREICEENPNARIVVIDSLCASLGQGLLVHKAVMMKEAGKSMDEILTWIQDNRLYFCHEFTVDDLFNLHRGGRVSKATAIIGTLINVKPVLHVDDEGRLMPVENVRGRKKSLIALVDHMEEKIGDFKNDTVFISHGDCLEDAEFVRDLVTKRFGITNFIINYVSPTIGAHSGPGTVALFYMGTHR